MGGAAAPPAPPISQPLMKPYADAGLVNLAKVAGYKSGTLRKCGNFRRSHLFILQCYEALYGYLLKLFFSNPCSRSDMVTRITDLLDKFALLDSDDSLEKFRIMALGFCMTTAWHICQCTQLYATGTGI